MNKTAKPRPKKNGTGQGAASGGSLLDELKGLYDFMKSNALQSFELERKDYHVRLIRKSAVTVPVPVPVAAGAVPAAAPAAAGAPPAAPAAPALPPNAVLVKSPMMGIFYRASSPSSPPFVREGDTVKPGDVLCLIEAMKVFNDIKAEVGGVIQRVFLENGKPVKVGQEMFVIEKK
jgi:acetyl-CoA carboxylase biotin carboxyl carrier protein